MDEQTAAAPVEQTTEQPAATPNPAPSGDWREALPPEFKEAPYFKGDGKTPEQVLADLENAASWQGNSIRIPGPDAGEEDRKAFIEKAMEKLPGIMPVPDYDNQPEVLARMGKPEAPEGYQTPEGVDIPEAIKESAFNANLTQAQFDALIKQEMTELEQQASARETAQKATEEALKEAWGLAAEDRLRDVEALLEAPTAPESMREAFKSKSLDAETIKFLYSVVESGAEKAAVVEKSEGREGRLTPLEAREQAAEIWKQMYNMSSTDPRYGPLKQKRTELVKMYAGI